MLMALSWFILRARYRLIHFIAVAVCLLGVGTMVGADILAGRQNSEGKELVIIWAECGNMGFMTFLLSKGRQKKRKLMVNGFGSIPG